MSTADPDNSSKRAANSEFARYQRQMLLPAIGRDGQARLQDSHALIVGCGALGCAAADLLARAGVGRLTIIDRDFVEITNLQRQVLYDEPDVAEGIPKAEAARRRLSEINSQVQIEAIVDDVNHRNLERYLGRDGSGIDVLVDGLDNFETRYLLNDASVAFGVPYVYGGAVATGGMTATFLPRLPSASRAALRSQRPWDVETESTPCLRCVFPEAPPPGTTPTCDTAGVLGPIVTMIASFEAAEAMKILLGEFGAINRDLVSLDVWRNEIRRLQLAGTVRGEECPCCGRGEFEYLEGTHAGSATSLCGRHAVQIAGQSDGAPLTDLSAVAARLAGVGEIKQNEFMLRVQVPEPADAPCTITLFPNGRAIVHGTDDPAYARSLFARYIGL